MKIIILSVIIGLAFCTGVHAANRALIIGVGTYPHPNINQLPNPENDLRESRRIAASVLGFHPNEIKVLAESEATRENILATFDNWLIKDSQPGDNIYFYFSGHGTRVTDKNLDEEDGADEVILPYDTRQPNDLIFNHISDDELRERFKQLSDRQVIAVFDSCNSGTVTRGLGNRETIPVKTIPMGDFANPTQTFLDSLDGGTIIDSPQFQEERAEMPFLEHTEQLTVWSAASSTQLAYTDTSNPERANSKFTQLLFDGLISSSKNNAYKKADFNQNGVVSNSELLTFVRRGSQDYCSILKRHGACRLGLTPELSITETKRNLPFGYVSGNMTQPATLVSDALPEQQQDNISEFKLGTLKGETSTISVNEKMFIRISSKKAGYLYVFDHDEEGGIRLLYPCHGKPQAISTAESKLIPNIRSKQRTCQVRAFKPGKAELVAVVVEDPVDVQQLIKQLANNKALTSKQLGTFASKIQATYVGDSVNRPVNYSIKRLPYVVK